MHLQLRPADYVPLYDQITTQIRDLIVSGELKPGEKLPSYNQIRATYGIHTNTMEKVLVRLEGEGLVERRRGSGVFVCPPARKSTHGVIGLSGGGFTFEGNSSYWMQLMRGIRQAADEAGQQLLMLDESHKGWEKADGVLVCDWLAYKDPSRIPVAQPSVSLLVPVAGGASVFADDYTGTRQAVEYLLNSGHTRIAFLHSYDSEQPALQKRVSAYRDAFEAVNLEWQPQWERCIQENFVEGEQIITASHNEMRRWIECDWKKLDCTALLCHNDETAVGAIKCLHEHGQQVPNDVSVIGFDDTEICQLTSPKLSSVRVPLREIGAEAIKLLMQQIESDTVLDEHRVLATEFQARESSANARNYSFKENGHAKNK
jgi:DNA-binding LacI/PurR family transcriptional regulator